MFFLQLWSHGVGALVASKFYIICKFYVLVFLKYLILPYFPDPSLINAWWILRVESCALRERGLAHGTWANKVSHLKSFISFTTFFGVQDFPIQQGVLLRFIALLGRSSYSSKSVANIISSLKFFASILCPKELRVFDSVLVASALKGLKA